MSDTRTVRIEHEEEVAADRVAEFIAANALPGDRVQVDFGTASEVDFEYGDEPYHPEVKEVLDA